MDNDFSMVDPVSCVTLAQAASLLGVTSRTVRTCVKDPAIALPAFKVGGRLLFKRIELSQYLSRHRIQPPQVDDLVNEIIADIRTVTSRQKPGARSQSSESI